MFFSERPAHRIGQVPRCPCPAVARSLNLPVCFRGFEKVGDSMEKIRIFGFTAESKGIGIAEPHSNGDPCLGKSIRGGSRIGIGQLEDDITAARENGCCCTGIGIR